MFTKRDVILSWAESGDIPYQKILHAFRVAGIAPDRAGWREFIDRLLLWGGALFLAAGAIFFFAYNWDNMGIYARFGLAELLLALSLLIYFLCPADSPQAYAALFCAALLTGALMALFGQTYQTGADPWQLFATWGLAILPWTLVARIPLLWLLLLVLANIAVALYFKILPRTFLLQTGNTIQPWLHWFINCAALLVWEWAAQAGVAWVRNRWLPRLMALVGSVNIVWLVLWAVFERRSIPLPITLGCYGVWITAMYCYYRRTRLDLFVLSSMALTLVIITTAILSRYMLYESTEAFSFLIIGLSTLGLSALCGLWLKQIAEEVTR